MSRIRPEASLYRPIWPVVFPVRILIAISVKKTNISYINVTETAKYYRNVMFIVGRIDWFM
jgi:hypothetical protein